MPKPKQETPLRNALARLIVECASVMSYLPRNHQATLSKAMHEAKDALKPTSET